MNVYSQIGILFLLILIGCKSENSIKTPQQFKKIILRVNPPVLPPDQICTTETFEIENSTLKYSKSESLCGGSTPKIQSKKLTLPAETRTQIIELLAKLQSDKFSNDSKYDGNPPASLEIKWANLKENFSFLYYEGKEITELYAILQTIVK